MLTPRWCCRRAQAAVSLLPDATRDGTSRAPRRSWLLITPEGLGDFNKGLQMKNDNSDPLADLSTLRMASRGAARGHISAPRGSARPFLLSPNIVRISQSRTRSGTS